MDERTRKLEEIVKCMLQPLKGVPLDIVIDALSGYKIIPFDKNNNSDRIILDDLVKVAQLSGDSVNKEGLVSSRVNEVGNRIELYVKKAFNTLGMIATTPHGKSGKEKSVGYPDIEFKDRFGNTQYLEIKTFNIKNINTRQRSFYLSPSEDFKITQDAHHFLLSFEVVSAGNNTYKCKSWKLLSLENLDVDVKYEFNSSNSKLYTKEMIIAEGYYN